MKKFVLRTILSLTLSTTIMSFGLLNSATAAGWSDETESSYGDDGGLAEPISANTPSLVFDNFSTPVGGLDNVGGIHSDDRTLNASIAANTLTLHGATGGYWYSTVPKGTCANESAYSGISFTAKASSNVTIQIGLQDKIGCGATWSNHPVSLNLTTGYQTFTIPFTQFSGLNTNFLWAVVFQSIPSGVTVNLQNEQLNSAPVSACRVLNGQSVAPRAVHRGMYFSPLATSIGSMPLTAPYQNILSSTAKQNQLLTFIVKNQFDSLTFYDLHSILPSASLSGSLSSFIQAARDCGVVEMNAVGSQNSDFDTIKRYQGQNSGKFDGVTVENEFWNAGSSNITHAFNSLISTLKYIRSLDIKNNSQAVKLSIYLGWLNRDPNTSEATAAMNIAQNVDRLYIHCYVKSPTTAFGYCQGRIQDFLNTGIPLEFYPIFSSEGAAFNAGSGGFMGDWLAANSLSSAENLFSTSFTNKYGSSKLSFDFVGYQYYEYAFLGLYVK
ncbi:MAG: hypothetical protein ABIQ95_10620 [Bdellovibrionia bacterium]